MGGTIGVKFGSGTSKAICAVLMPITCEQFIFVKGQGSAFSGVKVATEHVLTDNRYFNKLL